MERYVGPHENFKNVPKQVGNDYLFAQIVRHESMADLEKAEDYDELMSNDLVHRAECSQCAEFEYED